MIQTRKTVPKVALWLLCVLVCGCATAAPQAKVQVRHPAAAQAGETVYLSHGGSHAAQQQFALNTVVPVYRYEGTHSTMSTGIIRNEVGKVKITRDLGENVVEAVVVEGAIRNRDAAQ